MNTRIPKKFVVASALALVAILSGCATQQTAHWAHPSLAGQPGAADRAMLAKAECDAYAAGRAPRPSAPIYMPVPAPTSYTTTGNYQSYGGGGVYTGTTTASGGFATGFANGLNQGAALAAMIEQDNAIKRMRQISAACMRQLGWIDVATEEGKAKFRQVAGKTQEATGDVAAAQNTGTQGNPNPWLVAFVHASESAKKLSWKDKNSTIEAETFVLGAPFGAGVAGVSIATFYDSPMQVGGQMVDGNIIYYAFDCNAKTGAVLQNVRIFDGKSVYLDQIKGRPQFFAPPNDNVKTIMGKYCYHVYGQ